MSNYRAVAQATAALRQFLARRVTDDLAISVQVTTEKPPAEPTSEARINIFLYQVTPNAALRNRDAPTRDANGNALTTAQAAIDLHYLISFYGNDAELVSQRLLGATVRALYDEPVLSRQDIEAAATLPYLLGADLAQSPQAVRFTPTQMDVDDLSKLWSMLFQVPYALSVVYQAGVVLLDGRGTPAAGKPVLARTVRAVPGGRPVIERVLSRPAGSAEPPEDGPAPRDHEIWLVGHGLRGDGVTVRIGEQEIVPADVRDDRVVLSLPDPDPAPGVYPIQVRQDVRTGSAPGAPILRGVLDSNVVTLMRQPRIVGVEATQAPAAPPVLTVHTDVNLRDNQRVQLLLDELDPPQDRAPRSYRFTASVPLGPVGRPPDQVRLETPGVMPGGYLVRIEVDGVRSFVATDLSAPSVDLGGG
ncbi:MAG TPA: DUF4255 domain-containing protein [Streptosporangiaceae bacterium]|nr:DUF4255 domain-containing protein [Streptosporangiaceae bacterium]